MYKHYHIRTTLPYSVHPGTPHRYRPIRIAVKAAIATGSHIKTPLTWIPSLEISKGLPPPLSCFSGVDAAAAAVVLLVLVACDPFLEVEVVEVMEVVDVVEVVAGDPPLPPTTESEVEVLAAAVVDVEEVVSVTELSVF